PTGRRRAIGAGRPRRPGRRSPAGARPRRDRTAGRRAGASLRGRSPLGEARRSDRDHRLGAVPPLIPCSTKVLIGSSSRVNSVGITNFVAGLAPNALSASRYWSAIVFWSIPDAAP